MRSVWSSIDAISGECGVSGQRKGAGTVDTMMRAVRGYFRFSHIDGFIDSDPAASAQLSKVHRDEGRTEGLDRLELIRFLQIAQILTDHHGALAYLLGINVLRASETAVSLAPIDRVRMVDRPVCESADIVRIPFMTWTRPLRLVACRYVDFGRTSSAVCCLA